MLVTSLCWWLYDDDWFQILVAEYLCWRLFSLCWWFSQCIKSVTNILNRSPTFQTCEQHIWSPTSVTNIDVTVAPWCHSGWHPQFSKLNLKTWLILHSELSFLTIASFPYPSKRDFKSSVRELFAAFDASICALDDNFNLLILIKWETTSRILIQGITDCDLRSD